MYCFNCGAQVEGRYKFCPECGANLEGVTAGVADKVKASYPAEKTYTESEEYPVEAFEGREETPDEPQASEQTPEEFSETETPAVQEEVSSEPEKISAPEEEAERTYAEEVPEKPADALEDEVGEDDEEDEETEDEQEAAAARRKKRNIIIGVVAGLALLAAVLAIYFMNRTVTVDLNQFVTPQFEGYDTVGTAQAKFSKKQMKETYGSRIRYRGTEEEREALSQPDGDESDIALLIENCIHGTLDVGDGLSNGDTVTFTWEVDEELAEEQFHVQFEYSDLSWTVEGLEEVEFFDPFDSIKVEFYGKDGEAYAEVVMDDFDDRMYGLDYDVYPADGLYEGDEVTVTLYYTGDERDYIEEYECLPSPMEMTYTVDELIPVETESSGDGDTEGMIFPNSDTEELTDADVSGKTDAQLQTAINEIYARHGYTFNDETILNQFKNYSWYTPTTPASSFSQSVFNSTELKNIQFLKSKLNS